MGIGTGGGVCVWVYECVYTNELKTNYKQVKDQRAALEFVAVISVIQSLVLSTFSLHVSGHKLIVNVNA